MNALVLVPTEADRTVVNTVCTFGVAWSVFPPTAERATGKAGNGKRKREAGTGKDHRWCAKRHRYDVGRLKTH